MPQSRKNLQMLNIISLGAGVQSSTMALMAMEGEIEPMPDCAIFADTHSEPKAVYEYLDWLERTLPFPVYRVSGGNLREVSLAVKNRKSDGASYMNGNLPMYTENGGPLGRSCTRDFKITPIRRKVKELIGLKKHDRFPKETVCMQWLGISLDEIQRMKMQVEPWQDFRHPLIEVRMTRQDCLDWIELNGYPEPPRSACTFCPFHSNTEWQKLTSDEFQGAVDYEREMHNNYEVVDRKPDKGRPYLHVQRVPLDEVVFVDDNAPEQLSFLDECAGMCGV